MLRTYHIETTTLRLNDKADLFQLHPPFIAQVANDLAIVTAVEEQNVTYRWYDTSVCEPLPQFIEKWSGVVLLAAPGDGSKEPDIEQHRRDANWEKRIRTLCVCCALAIGIGSFWVTYTSARLFALQLAVFIVSAIGTVLSGLLLSEQLHIGSTLARRICKTAGHNGCHSVLQSKGTKLFGVLGWSEIGCTFFLVNALSALLLPQLLPYVAIATLPALPYTVWSVWYQKYKAHSWCPLCLLVQLSIWLLFAVFAGGGAYSGLHLTAGPAILLSALYGFLLALTHLSIHVFSKARTSDMWKYSYLSLKHRKDIFFNSLTQQPAIPTETASTLYFGSESALHLITVFSNPYCHPCAQLHKHLKLLLSEEYRLQYVMTYFNDDLKEANRRIIATYHIQGAERTWELLCDWYESDKAHDLQMFCKQPFNEETTHYVDEEMRRHQEWAQKNRLDATPYVLLDGHPLPPGYSVDDITELA